MAGRIAFKDLPKELQDRVAPPLRRKAVRSMTMHEIRTSAIRALATMADLSQAERARVIRQLGKVNNA